MNIDQPDARELLETARRVLKTQILPDIPREKALDVLMTMRVVEIAGRALAESVDALETRSHDRFAALPGSAPDLASLSAAIRSGAWDEPGRARELHAVLTEDARDRLARINPRYLASLDS